MTVRRPWRQKNPKEPGLPSAMTDDRHSSLTAQVTRSPLEDGSTARLPWAPGASLPDGYLTPDATEGSGGDGCCLLSLVLQVLAKKVYTLYSLAVQQLSRQDHYDFGLRALTSLLRYAGKKRRLQPGLSDEEVGGGHGPWISAALVPGPTCLHGRFPEPSFR